MATPASGPNKATPEKDAPAKSSDETVTGGGVLTPAGTPEPVFADAKDADASPVKHGEVVDPRSGEKGTDKTPGLKGLMGFDENLNPALGLTPSVDPNRIPADVTTGVMPNAGGDRLLASAQAKAPSLTREYVDKMKLTDADLGAIARGEVPPPPMPGPIYTADMYLTPGGPTQLPPGVSGAASDPDERRFGRR